MKGNKNSITVWNQAQLIGFDLVVRTRNGACSVSSSQVKYANWKQQTQSFKQLKAVQ
jgi:hypothetical protein